MLCHVLHRAAPDVRDALWGGDAGTAILIAAERALAALARARAQPSSAGMSAGAAPINSFDADAARSRRGAPVEPSGGDAAGALEAAAVARELSILRYVASALMTQAVCGGMRIRRRDELRACLVRLLGVADCAVICNAAFSVWALSRDPAERTLLVAVHTGTLLLRWAAPLWVAGHMQALPRAAYARPPDARAAAIAEALLSGAGAGAARAAIQAHECVLAALWGLFCDAHATIHDDFVLGGGVDAAMTVLSFKPYPASVPAVHMSIVHLWWHVASTERRASAVAALVTDGAPWRLYNCLLAPELLPPRTRAVALRLLNVLHTAAPDSVVEALARFGRCDGARVCRCRCCYSYGAYCSRRRSLIWI